MGCTIPAAASTKPTQKRRPGTVATVEEEMECNAIRESDDEGNNMETDEVDQSIAPETSSPEKKDEPKSVINEEEQKLEHAGKHMSGEYECSDDEPDVTDDFGDDKEESTRKKLANLLGVTLDEKPKETSIAPETSSP